MAIDTETKRRATHGVWAAVRILPVPVAGINAADRQHLWIYPGIAAGAPVVPTFTDDDDRHGRIRGGRRRRK